MPILGIILSFFYTSLKTCLSKLAQDLTRTYNHNQLLAHWRGLPGV